MEDLTLREDVVEVRGVPTHVVDAATLVPEGGLHVAHEFTPAQGTTWASGCHGVVVEVDLETYRVDVARYVMSHDSGRLINPTNG